MHLWSKYGNPDFNQWWLIARRNSQTQNGVNFDFEVKFDLEGQGQSLPKTIGILTKGFYTYGPNMVILAWTPDELSRRQTWWRTNGLTEGRTDAGNDNTWRPKLASGKKTIVMNFFFYQQRNALASDKYDMTWHRYHQQHGPVLLIEINWQWFSNLASDWLAAVLPSNQRLSLKILINQHGF